LHLKFPIICRKIDRGENVFYLDSIQLFDYLDLEGVDTENLSTALCDELVKPRKPKPVSAEINPLKRAQQYKSLIDLGIVKNQSELADYLGKSRAWVSKAMKILRQLNR